MKPRFTKPQLATLTPSPFSEEGWLFEEKFDGIRCIAIKSGQTVQLYSRNHKPLNKEFPQIVSALENLKAKDLVLDGEIVAFEGEVTSFAKLQRRRQEKTPITYFAFDLLHLGDQSLKDLPLTQRKKKLKMFLPARGKVRYTPHILSKGEALFEKARKKGLEGIIAKRGDAPYRSRRSRAWLKIKCTNQQELVIGGYTEPKGARIGFGALLVGYYDKGKLRYAGKIGTGFDTKELERLSKKLQALRRASSPFSETPKESGAHFVTPTLICEVAFTEWTKGGKLRHPRYLALRADKSAKEVRR